MRENTRDAAHAVNKAGAPAAAAVAATGSPFAALRYDRRLGQAGSARGAEPDLVCFSRMRWDFDYRSPQNLLSDYAQERRVFFVEEPVVDSGSMRLEVSRRDCGVWVVVPHIPEGLKSEVALEAVGRAMIDRLFRERGIRDYVLWHDGPSARRFTSHLKPLAVVHNWQDEHPPRAERAATV